MNQFPTLQKLGTLVRLETVLLGLVLVVAVAGYILYQQVGDADNEKLELKRQLATVGDDLAYLKANNSTVALEEELEQLQSKPEPKSAPSRLEALEFSTAMVTFAEGNKLRLTTFNTAKTSASRGGTEVVSFV